MSESSGTRPLNPQRLDVAALADRHETIGGDFSLGQLPRLNEPTEPPQDSDEMLRWQARAEYRPVRGGAPQLWLHLAVQATVHRTCQRCLQPVALALSPQRDFLFAPTEEQAEAWDAEYEEADVLVLTKSLNLLELVEDELLLALPIVPRHEVCPQPLAVPQAPASQAIPPGETQVDHPFAVLAQLKRPN